MSRRLFLQLVANETKLSKKLLKKLSKKLFKKLSKKLSWTR